MHTNGAGRNANFPLFWLLSLATACGGAAAGDADPIPGGTASLQQELASPFDPNPSPSDGFRVVDKLTPAAWAWGEIELLEGSQRFRHEGFNHRSDKLRSVDTFQSDDYPLRTYMGALNQMLVDGFNLAYHDTCASGARACPEPGPTRPEARYVLLHKGPRTAARTCNLDGAPVLLVPGAIQDATVYLFPGGNDGKGGAYPGTTTTTGLVQALEADGRCAYALTFVNYHGDNFNQAIHIANSIARIRQLHTRRDGTQPKVDIVAWSKGVLAVDAYVGNAATWPRKGTRYFDDIGMQQSSDVPAFRGDVRVYVALSGPHGGLDLNFRHPIHTLTIGSMPSNGGRGPMMWSWFSALQCVTWGPDSPWYDNPYDSSVCKDRGGTWPDYFNRIYISNLTGLDSTGKPVSRDTLKKLNVTEGVASSSFDFDEYNISLFGSIDDKGRHISPYLGQLQASADLRPLHPIPRRNSTDWKDVDPDENRWFPWIGPKLLFLGGGYLDDSDHTKCRAAAFLPSASPCIGWHMYYNSRNAESTVGFYSKYQLIGSLGMETAVEMGGHFIARLAAGSLDPRLESLYLLYGESAGAAGSAYETDGMSCPTCAANSDGVVFKESVAPLAQLTQSWSTTKRLADAKSEGMSAYSHLDMGVAPAVWDRIIAHLHSRD